MGKSLYQKLYDAHVIYETEHEIPLLYIDRHLVHEVTSPQAFDSLRTQGRTVRQPSKTFATMDHNVSTANQRHQRLWRDGPHSNAAINQKLHRFRNFSV